VQQRDLDIESPRVPEAVLVRPRNDLVVRIREDRGEHGGPRGVVRRDDGQRAAACAGKGLQGGIVNATAREVNDEDPELAFPCLPEEGGKAVAQGGRVASDEHRSNDRGRVECHAILH
jgi:hypothetical protein